MSRPSIVFVFADQLRSHDLGCYGDQQVKTPSFDRLAKEGTRFSHAISTHPRILKERQSNAPGSSLPDVRPEVKMGVQRDE